VSKQVLMQAFLQMGKISNHKFEMSILQTAKKVTNNRFCAFWRSLQLGRGLSGWQYIIDFAGPI
jgi:hypothetical protein